jgi:hypothetical protein
VLYWCCCCSVPRDFASLTSNTTLQAALQAAYGSIDNVDPWVGAIVEAHAYVGMCAAHDMEGSAQRRTRLSANCHLMGACSRFGGSLGSLSHNIVVDQFIRSRSGDSWWYERTGVLDSATLKEVQQTQLVNVADAPGRCCSHEATKLAAAVAMRPPN